jgi:hypothetical protein
MRQNLSYKNSLRYQLRRSRFTEEIYYLATFRHAFLVKMIDEPLIRWKLLKVLCKFQVGLVGFV